jgi:hypothetical protein
MRGSRPGERRGGRQRGVKNKRTVARERALADTAAKITGVLGAGAFEGDAHALLMAVYKDMTRPIELRMDAAKAAIGYEKPRLAAVDAKHTGTITLEELIGLSYETGRHAKEKQKQSQDVGTSTDS